VSSVTHPRRRERAAPWSPPALIGVGVDGNPSGNREGARLSRIGVGFDGGPRSRAALDLAASIAEAAGARTEIAVTAGDTTEALYGLCDHVDLVVIGSGRTAPPGRILLGDTGDALLRDAPAPILVTPRPVD
jgi:nucleotide-binding universal stress UspA family protein